MTPQKPEYVGRHRPSLSWHGVLVMALSVQTSQRRDREAALFGYHYFPRHSAAHREQAAS